MATIAQGWLDTAELSGSTAESFEMVWTYDLQQAQANSYDYYDIIGAWLERPSRKVEWLKVGPPFVTTIKVPGNQRMRQARVVIQLPGVGHFTFQERGCWKQVPPIADICTAYASSLDPTIATVNGVKRSWRIYRYLAPPTGGGIEPTNLQEL